MRYRLLGSLAVERHDGTPVRVSAPKRRALLAILLLQRGRPIHLDRLIDALWGERAPDSAEGSLFAHVSRLRRELAPHAIESVPGGYVLSLADDALDIMQFERTVAAGHAAIAVGRWSVGSAVLGDALGLWRGPALAEFATQAFAQAEVTSLDGLRESALEARIGADLMLGRHRELVPELERLVHLHPLREPLWAHLMLALYRSGRQSDALERYRALRRTLVSELGLEPSAQVEELQRRILRHDPALVPPTPERRPARLRLPEPTTTFFGRDRELERAIRSLADHRELTLTGPGGVGKTRLSIALADALISDYPDGTVFVDLSSVVEPERVGDHLADALGGGRPTDVIGRARLLLVLDNFEQVIAAAPLVAELLAKCRNLRIVVTSRAPLRIAGERTLAVEPLAVAAAAALFIDRAKTALHVEALDAELVREVVDGVDRLPLAVELAAARTVAFSLETIRNRLREPLLILGPGRRDAPERHRGLRSTIAWSYQLLSPRTQTAFRALSVLAAGFDLDAARAIAGADNETIDELVSQSLLQRTSDRYSMLQTIRAFAAEQADAHGETRAARDRHLAHYSLLPLKALGGRAGRQSAGSESAAWAQICAADSENFQLAFEWAAATDDRQAILDLYGGMSMYWLFRGLLDVGRRWSEVAMGIVADASAEEQIAVLVYATEFARFGGDLRAALALRERLVSLARQVGDLAEVATGLEDIGWIHAALDDFPAAWAALREAEAVHDLEDACDPAHRAYSQGTAAEVMVREGRVRDPAGVLEALEQAERQIDRDDPGWIASAATTRGQVLLAVGDRDRARSAFLRVLETASALEYRAFASNALEGLAEVERVARPEIAALALGLADRIRLETRSLCWLPERRAATLEVIGAALGGGALERLRLDGEGLALSALVGMLADGPAEGREARGDRS